MTEERQTRKRPSFRREDSGHFADLLRNPVKLFTGEEIAAVMEVSVSWVVAARKAGAPFPGGRSRPEWILDWLRANPTFTLKEHRG